MAAKTWIGIFHRRRVATLVEMRSAPQHGDRRRTDPAQHQPARMAATWVFGKARQVAMANTVWRSTRSTKSPMPDPRMGPIRGFESRRLVGNQRQYVFDHFRLRPLKIPAARAEVMVFAPASGPANVDQGPARRTPGCAAGSRRRGCQTPAGADHPRSRDLPCRRPAPSPRSPRSRRRPLPDRRGVLDIAAAVDFPVIGQDRRAHLEFRSRAHGALAMARFAAAATGDRISARSAWVSTLLHAGLADRLGDYRPPMKPASNTTVNA